MLNKGGKLNKHGRLVYRQDFDSDFLLIRLSILIWVGGLFPGLHHNFILIVLIKIFRLLEIRTIFKKELTSSPKLDLIKQGSISSEVIPGPKFREIASNPRSLAQFSMKQGSKAGLESSKNYKYIARELRVNEAATTRLKARLA